MSHSTIDPFSASGSGAQADPSAPRIISGQHDYVSRMASEWGLLPGILRIFAGRLFDPYSLELLRDRAITVSTESGLILDVRPFTHSDYMRTVSHVGPEQIVDLRQLTVLPGFVDAHVHFFLHPYAEASEEDQITKETLAERTIRASVHAGLTLMAGYTAVRDLGTEGAGDADIALRKCISGPNPVIAGPRYFCANRAIATTGSYGVRSRLHPQEDHIDGVAAVDNVDGVDACIKAVRRQVGAGADWIKIYADYRTRSRMADVSPQTSRQATETFNDRELHAIVSTAHGLGVKVAAHTTDWPAWRRLAGFKGEDRVDSVEHGYNIATGLTDEEFEVERNMVNAMAALTWVPTLSVYYTLGSPYWEAGSRAFRLTLKKYGEESLRIACGGDTGTFPHGDNALEMKLMVRLGANWRYVLRWATLSGWECIRSRRWEGKAGEERLARVGELGEDTRIVGDNEVPFGAVEKGFAADIIATSGDLSKDFESAVDKQSIVFVMKGGRVYKRDIERWQ